MKRPRDEPHLGRGGVKKVETAEAWRWSSLWVRGNEEGAMKGKLAEWPVERPGDWLARVNRAQGAKELAALREAVERGREEKGS